MLTHAEEFARSLELMELRLYTSIHLTENVKLYERVGHRLDREEEALPRLGIFVYMSKRYSMRDSLAACLVTLRGMAANGIGIERARMRPTAAAKRAGRQGAQ